SNSVSTVVGTMARLVVFDIDGTLVPGVSSEVRFVRYLWSRRVLGPRQLLAYAWFCLRYALRYRQHLMQKNKAYLSGLGVERVQALAMDFAQQLLVPALYAPALKRLQAHKAAGDTVVLLSGTPQFLADALAGALGVEAGYGALCCVRDGAYCVAPPQRHPYGATKVQGAQALADAAGLALSDAVAYGDSVHDAHLFRLVAEAVAVQPDRGLYAVAAGEGWEVLLD